MDDKQKILRKIYYNLNDHTIEEGYVEDFDFNGCYKYTVFDTELPFPNGEVFGPSTNNFENRKYGYINYCYIKPEDEDSCKNEKLCKLKIILEDDTNIPNINIPYGITEVEFCYKDGTPITNTQ